MVPFFYFALWQGVIAKQYGALLTRRGSKGK